MSGRGSALALAAVAALFLLFPSVAGAEPYLAGYVGVAIMQDKDIRSKFELDGLTPPALDLKLKDVEFDTSVMFGGKAGYFFQPVPQWDFGIGLELEVYHFQPDVNEQTVKVSGTFFGTPIPVTEVPLPKAEIDVTTIGLNEIFRLQLVKSENFPKGRLHPYVGIGLGIFIADLKTTFLGITVEDTDVQPGLQLLAGAKFFVTKHIALFGEYKFIHTGEFKFEGEQFGVTETFKSALTGHHLYGGVAFHF